MALCISVIYQLTKETCTGDHYELRRGDSFFHFEKGKCEIRNLVSPLREKKALIKGHLREIIYTFYLFRPDWLNWLFLEYLYYSSSMKLSPEFFKLKQSPNLDHILLHSAFGFLLSCFLIPKVQGDNNALRFLLKTVFIF